MKKYQITYTIEAKTLAQAIADFAFPDGEERTNDVEAVSIEEVSE